MAGRFSWIFLVLLAVSVTTPAQDKEPPGLNPFGPAANKREDALPGYLEMSDGTIHLGQIYLTRDHRLKIFDPKEDRHREIPLTVVQRIEGKILKEWMEKEWRFKENANDEKVYTGRAYPAREYVHAITLRDGRKIEGPLAAIVYLHQDKKDEADRFFLHKRAKGENGDKMNKLVYVKTIVLGDKALAEGKDKAAKKAAADKKAQSGKKTKK